MGKTYLVRFTPLDNFFFGDESRYRKEKDKDGKPTSKYITDYYQESLKFPQQTTILGTLRYLILEQNGLLSPISSDKKQNVTDAIGTSSFKIGEDDGFGYLNKISPVFIYQDGKSFYPNSKSRVVHKKEYNDETVTEVEEIQLSSIPSIRNVSPKDQLIIDKYNEKEGLSSFITCRCETTYLPYDKFFRSSEQIGIKKGKDGATEDNAFYKQVSYQLQGSSAFAVFASFTEEFTPQDGFVRMGAEKSPFRITFEESVRSDIFNDVTIPTDIPEEEYYKLVLESDTYIDQLKDAPALLAEASLSIITTKSFRFFEGGKRHFKIKDRSDRYNLIERGSVVYFKEKEDLDIFIGKIDSHSNFKRIGYNYYRVETVKIK